LFVTTFALTANAQVIQFDASRPAAFSLSGNAVQEWRAVRPGTALAPFHAPGNGWAAVTRLAPYGTKATVSFNGGGNATPSPLAFGENAAATISAVFAVVKCETPAPLSTLMDAPVDVRTAAKPAIPPSWAFPEEQLGNAVSYRVNGVQTADFAPSASFQLIEIHFPAPPELRELFIGGAIPAPHWRRNWRGEVAELLFLPSAPSPQERNAIHHYVSVKWGVGVPYVNDFDIASRLRDLGISADVFSTRLIVR